MTEVENNGDGDKNPSPTNTSSPANTSDDMRKMLSELLKAEMMPLMEEFKSSMKVKQEEEQVVKQRVANPANILVGSSEDPNALVDARVNLLRSSGFKDEMIPEAYKHWFNDEIKKEESK